VLTFPSRASVRVLPEPFHEPDVPMAVPVSLVPEGRPPLVEVLPPPVGGGVGVGVVLAGRVVTQALLE
jgi:hypothetical protein